MRVRIPTMVAMLLFVGLVWPGGGSADIEPADDGTITMTVEEVRKEARTIFTIPGRTSLGVFEPMVWFGTTGVPLREFCFANGMLHHNDESKAKTFSKKAPENAHPIPVQMRFASSAGDSIYLYTRMVELPACK